MDDLVKNLEIFRNKRVLVTGDTGFKGSWLCLWLNELGAKVFGYALPPERNDDHYNKINVNKCITHRDGDIRNYDDLSRFYNETKPEFVFHLAAQSLVRRSYHSPKETFDTNVGGSINILECARASNSTKVVIYVTSDKCYKNKEWIWGYRENDELGGYDPYSASKASAEIAFSAYSDSFFTHQKNMGYASVRAGNVIGGGDWSEDRILPDCIRAIQADEPIILRKPNATRPWQHVIEPLGGYLLLASKLFHEPNQYSGVWNFGPGTHSNRTVFELSELVTKEWGNGKIICRHESSELHEAGLLNLNCDKANQILGWKPRWGFQRTVKETVLWYKKVFNGESVYKIGKEQLKSYMEGK